MQRFAAVLALSFLVQDQAVAYKLIEGPKWDLEDGPVGYEIDPAGSDDIDDGSDVEAIKSALHSWECVLCAAIQVRYDGDTPAKDPETGEGYWGSDDNHNVIYFVENEDDWPAGAGTISASVLGICAGGGGPYDSDIFFNGVTTVWSTAVPMTGGADIESIALHESGHLMGLDHPCNDEQETDCVPPDQAVMFPQYQGGIGREPLSDDQAGMCELYPPGKHTCEGGLKIGEKCERNCECEQDLRCIQGEDGVALCSPLCTSEATRCPHKFACMLAGRHGKDDGAAGGYCMAILDVNQLPASAACTRDLQCQTNSCGIVPDIGEKSVCVATCDDAAEDCGEGYDCKDFRCVLKGVDQGVPCPEDPPPDEGCECGAAGSPGAGLPLALLGLAVWALRRRRVARRWSSFLLLVALLAASPGARAAVVMDLDLDRMVELSDVIVQGRVTRVSAWESRPNGLIFTVVELQVTRGLLGAGDGEALRFLVAGGDIGTRQQIVPGSSRFEPGEEIVMFLSRWRQHLVPVAVGVGKLRVDRAGPVDPVVRDTARGVVAYRRTVDGEGILEPHKRLPDLPLQIFLEEVRGRIARRAEMAGGR